MAQIDKIYFESTPLNGSDALRMPLGTINEEDPAKSTLVSRNITILGHRTSVRLEPEMWNALKDIARREQCSTHEICSLIQLRKNLRTSLTAAIRVFLMLYYRAASTEQGHARAGHGSFENMKKRAHVTTPLYPADARRSDSGMSDQDQDFFEGTPTFQDS